MSSPFLFFAEDRLSTAELAAARLDGLLVELGEAYIPADAVETAALRAGSLVRLLGDARAASHLSAAWIHGALDGPPARHTVQRAVPHRLHASFDRRFVYRDPAIPPHDLVMVGGVHVTSPMRTIVDLARTPDPAHAEAALRMARSEPRLAGEALARVTASGPFPRKRAAVMLLRELTATAAGGQDEVTRYTS
ncbi:type IV toxin-antitoxin system AbiEi family antitoxin [Microbacter sp. GSS18]|nr:type IV toxin-antitoxin system AbiEi family antitoxin [Microbacter sp. GSS18]